MCCCISCLSVSVCLDRLGLHIVSSLFKTINSLLVQLCEFDCRVSGRLHSLVHGNLCFIGTNFCQRTICHRFFYCDLGGILSCLSSIHLFFSSICTRLIDWSGSQCSIIKFFGSIEVSISFGPCSLSLISSDLCKQGIVGCFVQSCLRCIDVCLILGLGRCY